MRVLFVTGEFPPMQGGVGDCTNEIAKALGMCGVECHVLTTDEGRRTPERRSGSDGGWTTGASESRVQVHRSVRKWDWGCLSIIRRAIRETRADIVHVQYQTAAFGMHPAINFTPRLFLRLGQQIRFATTFHDLRVPYLFPKAGALRDWITFELARSSDAAIATNEEDYARLVQKLGRRASLIPIGSNIDPTLPADYDREAWRRRLGAAPNELLLSYFGFLNDSKGGETLIRALAEIPHAKLLMIGGQVGASDPTNVAYLARVKNLSAELGTSARLLWTDYAPQAEVSAYFLASDICVLPYRDGASFRRGSFMAALAHGLPIVTTSPSPAFRKVERAPEPAVLVASILQRSQPFGVHHASGVKLPPLLDGENVMLVPPEEPHALADVIVRLAANSDLRLRLSQGARELAQYFTWDKIAAHHLELYEQLMNH